ncbi:response regulator [Trichocoleus sp. FACHB-591]|uniref:hybrid sensor histidine kinase/response regulator n=1 Tax=Trichocoleus sp. FACHB-591 TaxID=2692872 RepID=UPI001687CDA3|nr:response regulator [Trichocoleus sp. FACHB-591]MBD2093809.1 response regulator [Trichocoleus sp. FACHB-591]
MTSVFPFSDSPLVLLIDDDRSMRLLLAQAIKQEGYQVVEAKDGKEGLTLYQQVHPDIILMDALMPIMDGFACCAQLRTLPGGDRVPVLMITCLDDPASVDQAFVAGATDYVTKPIHWAVLRQRVRRLLETNRTTTELRQQTERARRSEDQLRLALEAAHMGTWNWDMSSGQVVMSATTAYNLGLAPTVLTRSSEDLLAMVHSEDAAVVNQATEAAIASGTSLDIELRVKWPDDSIHWVAAKGQGDYDANGQIIRMLGVTMDITERKQAEQKIREQAALLNVTTDAIVVQDLDSQIVFWNQGAERLYGWLASEVIGKNVNEFLPQAALPRFLQDLTWLQEHREWQGALNQVTKTGKAIVVASRWTLVQDESGQPKSILMVNTDITEQKKLEAQFLRSQRLESVGTLASGIAHDLNNSLAPILMSVQLLEKKVQDPQSRTLLSILESNTRRSADLVKQVLSFARGLEGEHTLLQIKHLLVEIEQMVKQTFPRSITIATELLPSDLWVILGDATQLHQVLMNLCVNARDAMPEGGTLSLAAENLWIDENYARMYLDAKVGPYVVLTVADTGMGISPSNLDKIFEPFFTTKEIGKGTGLGLSTVIGIVKGHGGFVTVHSQVGRGTAFKVYLPAKATTLERQAEVQHHLPKGHGELILVVDDEEPIRETTRISLEAYGYSVMTANDGIEAIAVYAQHQQEVSAVLIDMMMPSMDGPMTIRMLQKLDPEVKIIAVSGLVSGYEVGENNSIGVQTFLPKPYTAEELLKNLQTILNGKA